MAGLALLVGQHRQVMRFALVLLMAGRASDFTFGVSGMGYTPKWTRVFFAQSLGNGVKRVRIHAVCLQRTLAV